MTAVGAADYHEGVAPQMFVYQVINFNREEMFFGTSEVPLEKELERLAKDRQGPASGWAKGEVVSWRPLTELLDPSMAKTLHKQFESKRAPNKFRVIPTFVE